MTKKEAKKSLEELRNLVSDGDTIHYTVRKVSSSGLYRHIDFYKFEPYIKEGDGSQYRCIKLWLSYHIAGALDYPFKESTHSVGVQGGGMDMGFHVINSLRSALGYKKLNHEII